MQGCWLKVFTKKSPANKTQTLLNTVQTEKNRRAGYFPGRWAETHVRTLATTSTMAAASVAVGRRCSHKKP